MIERETAARLDRLVGDGNSVAGLDLATLFRVLLNSMQDSPAGQDVPSLARAVREAISNHARIRHLYRFRPDPWAALLDDALNQLAAQRLALRGEDGRWRLGPRFKTGERLPVIPGRRGKHASVGLTLYGASERTERGDAEMRRMEIKSIATRLPEDGSGLRALNEPHVAELAESMSILGYRPEFPVLIDQRGRILDGRHRLAAARRAGVAAVTKTVPIETDEEAVTFAILANTQRGWTKPERDRIDSDLRAAGLTVENFVRRLGPTARRLLPGAREPRTRPVWDVPELRQEIRSRLQAGVPVHREELMEMFSMTQSAVRTAIRVEQDAWKPR